MTVASVQPLRCCSRKSIDLAADDTGFSRGRNITLHGRLESWDGFSLQEVHVGV